ncbi:MAG TPA: hypothetical protein VGH51_20675 [Candidatus Angelobacter sp.]|jgi:hypothetical protein
MEGNSVMRRAATLVLFVLVAMAMAFAQNPAGTSNTPSNTPQTQNPANSSNPTAQKPATSPADLPQGNAAQPSNGNQAGPQSVSPANSTAVIDEVGAGTEIHATLDTPLSTRTSKAGDRFTSTISDPVRANNGAVVIPTGARVEGEVAEAEEGKTDAALHGKGKLSLRFRDVVLPSGQTLPLTATLVSVHDTGGKNNKKADEEGQIQPGTRNKDAARDMGIGAGIGATAGLVFGSPIKGLAIGALAGGGYVVSTKGKDVNLPAQAGMLIRVDQPLSWNGTSSPLQR